ncbi:hypothetical protein G7Y89_g9385 [Cudoniella acicularis]|uniref:Uncharacterized protein n=1 Tax=Cudoniella acicularis TaxID=354080 RepID=A0A8H4RGB0_9HELO|nr:hypothetical protein G7Y89_g9385 [Cudoniella acicularis]
MVPRRFTVNVNAKDGLIQVVPQNGTVNSTNLLVIVMEAFHTMASLSEVASTKFTPAIGNMLNSNINNVYLQQTGESNSTKTLRAIAETMQVITDDALIAYSRAQLILVKNTTQVPVYVVDAVTIGTAVYIYIVVGLNALVVLAVVLEAIRRKGWKGMPRFNYMSVKSTVVSSSMPGRAVGGMVEMLHGEKGSVWTGNAKDKLNGSIEVRLNRVNGLSLVIEGGSRGMSFEGASIISLQVWESGRESLGSGFI